MTKKKWLLGLMILALAAFTNLAVAQESAVKGNLGGTVYDSSGAVVPGAKVTITGPTITRSVESDGQGNFLFQVLTLGAYSVKVEKTGFKVAEVKNVEVFTNRTTSIRVTLEPGAIAETIEVNAPAVTLDPSAAGIGANLHDTFYQQVPVSRGIAGLFYLSAGVASGGLSGTANPSISGGSGLENLYVADGVNITDSAFGGLGVFSRVYGSLATGINLSFIKEVQVKTGGYEPQYGRATGGIIQIVTKSGGRDFHGALAGYFSPDKFEAERKHPDDFGRTNLLGKTIHLAEYDASAEVGGYVPGMRERVFWFGAFNPTRRSDFVLAPKTFALSRLGEMNLRTNTLNYAFKGTLKITDSHQLESSIFGDPSHTSTGAFNRLVIDNQTAFSKLEFGTRNWAFRYNGTLSPTWLLNASFTWGFNEFNETGFANIHNIVDRTQAAGLPGQRGIFTAVGLGFYEPTQSNTFGFNVDTSKMFRFAGQNTFNIGYRLERPFYDGARLRSGPNFAIPATNATGGAFGVPAFVIGQPANAAFSLRIDNACTLCPRMNIPGLATPQRVYLRQDRGEFGEPSFETSGRYHAVFAQDSWSPNKYMTVNLGLRWEQQRLTGQEISYTFTGNWSPRVGLIVDPFGNRRTKVYANFGRYNYAIPLDMAERSLSSEQSFIGGRWAPDFTTDAAGNRVARINQFGTVTPVLDAAHLLSRATGGTGGAPFVSTQSTTGINPGTKMEYVDEFVVGFEREFRGGVIFGARYIDRRMKRIVEDMSGVPPEAANAGVHQVYLIGNMNSQTDIFTNPIGFRYAAGGRIPAQCDRNLVLDPVEDTFGNVLGAVCYAAVGVNGFEPGLDIPDGVPDGFPDPVRIYQAVEIEVNKAFSRNWQMRANWRIAKLFGNFEGAFRNDNGQTDPSISSLYDFVQGDFGLLGEQFAPGVLNTDRRHIVNFHTSYVLDRGAKGLTLGAGVRVESGIPINRFKAHPAYLNSGEVPVGGRGALGRTPVTGSVDVHLDYPIKIGEGKNLRFGIDMFNIANAKRLQRIDQNEDASFGVKNLDFLKPTGRVTGFQRPFYARAMIRFEF